MIPEVTTRTRMKTRLKRWHRCPEKAFNGIVSGPEQPLYLEKEVLSTDGGLHFSPPPVRRSSRKRTSEAHTTSVNLLGHSDRKELLGRIGCRNKSYLDRVARLGVQG